MSQEPSSPPVAPAEPDQPAAPATEPRRRRSLWPWILFGVPVLLLALAAAALLGGKAWLEHWGERPSAGPAHEAHLTIKPGTSTRQIAHDLAARHLIDDERKLLAWLWMTGKMGTLQAGSYTIQIPISPSALVATLQHGAFDRKLTIPEGWTKDQIAARLAAQGWIADPQDWLDLVARPVPATYFGTAIPAGAEGFCFPDTYQLERGTTAPAILDKMLKTFAKVWRDARPDERSGGAEKLSIFELVTLASMVEREARVPEEMPHIASVYYNRLARGMKLQCCATVYYALGGGDAWNHALTLKDLKVDSPYNTYEHKGLPPGPIANPGRPALEAVLRPAQTGDLFYVYAGNQHHIFSKTYKEHLAAVAAVRKRDPKAGAVAQAPE